MAGQHDEAIAELERGLEADPLWASLRAGHAILLSTTGRHEEALEQGRLAMDIAPDMNAYVALADAYSNLSQHRSARSTADSGLAYSGRHN